MTDDNTQSSPDHHNNNSQWDTITDITEHTLFLVQIPDSRTTFAQLQTLALNWSNKTPENHVLCVPDHGQTIKLCKQSQR